jgi:hypothetical protein
MQIEGLRSTQVNKAKGLASYQNPFFLHSSAAKDKHCLVPVTHACNPWEAEIKRIVVQSQSGQIVCEILSENIQHKKGW